MTEEFYTRAQGDGTSVTEGKRYQYDLKGRLVSEGPYQGYGDSRSTAYNTHGEVVAKGVNGLWQERFQYDNGGRLYRSSAGDGVERMYMYDRAGRATISVTATTADISTWAPVHLAYTLTAGGAYAYGAYDAPGLAMTFTSYDNRGMALSTRQPFSQLSRDPASNAYTTDTITRSRTYNAFGEVSSETDPAGAVTDFTYNTMGRIIETRRPTVAYTNDTGAVLYARPTEQSRYDVSGRLVATRTANGFWTSRTLLSGSGHGDDEAIVTSQYNPDGGLIQYGVDVFGDVRRITDQRGFVTDQTFDKAGRLTSVAHQERAAWTAGNNKATAERLVDYYAYDGLGQRIQHWNSQFGSGYVERTNYDREGRVTRQTDFEGWATQYVYAWDTNLTTTGLGAFGGWVKTTYHASSKTSVDRTDAFGRSISRVDMGGRTYAMSYDLGGRMVGQTSSAGQNLAWQWLNTGMVGRQIDYTGAGTQADYAYDARGLRVRERYAVGGVVRQDGYATHDAMGRMTEFRDLSDNSSDPTRTVWTYDLNGNVRSTQTNFRNVDTAASAATAATSTFFNKYDAMDRMALVEGRLVDGQIVGGRRLEYDQTGNRVRMLTETSVQTDNIIDYVTVWVPDPVLDPGNGGGGENPELPPEDGGGGGGGGHYETYPVYEFRPGWIAENYTYTADGHLAQVGTSRDQWNTYTDAVEMSGITWLSEDTRDAVGRLTFHTETTGEGSLSTTYNRTVEYTRAGLITSEVTFTFVRNDPLQGVTAYGRNETTNYSYYEGSTWRGVVTSVTTSGYRDPWPIGPGNGTTPLASTRTDYSYVWWDDARQSVVTFDGDTTTTSNGVQTSTFSYDANGRIGSVYIADGRPRTVAFVTDAQGQVLTRTETDNNPNQLDPKDRYWYFNGQRIGQVSNNGEYLNSYFGEMYNRARTGPSTPTPFRFGNNPVYSVDFDLAYEALTPNSSRSSGQAWTVRDGDTLMGIAAAVWGDSSLWYLIAEANGLTSASFLTAGQILTVPPKAGNVHNNSDTFRPYDPNEALGNLNPSQPKPPRNAKKGCGVIGQVIAVAIAIVVAAAIAPYAIAAIANLGAASGFTGAGVAGALATGSTAVTGVGSLSVTALATGGAIAGAAGSIASQAFGLATGMQDKFDWKGVGLAALSSAVSGGLGKLMKLADGASKSAVIANAVQRGAAASVLTQGVAVATGLQSSFNWSSVAVSAVSSGAGAAISTQLPSSWSSLGRGAVSGFAGGIVGVGAQSLIEGSSFGDNLRSQLPSIIGNTIGNAIAGGLAEQADERARQDYWESQLDRMNRDTGGYYTQMGAEFDVTPDGIRVTNADKVLEQLQRDADSGLIRSQIDRFEDPIDSRRDYVNTFPHEGLEDTFDYGGVIFEYDTAQTDRIQQSRWVTVGNSYATRFITGNSGTYLYTEGSQKIGALNLTLSVADRMPTRLDPVNITGERAWTANRIAHTVLNYTGMGLMGILKGGPVDLVLGTYQLGENGVGTLWDFGVSHLGNDQQQQIAADRLARRGQTFMSGVEGIKDFVVGMATDGDFRSQVGGALADRYTNEGPMSLFNLTSDATNVLTAFLPATQAGKVNAVSRTVTALDDVGEVGALVQAVDGTSRAAMRARVLANIDASRSARASSNIDVLFAKEAQMGGAYGGLDAWQMTSLPKGSVIFGGFPGQTAFYTDAAAVTAANGSRQALFESLQVAPDSVMGYRHSVRAYEVLSDIRVPTSQTLANPHLGAGGANQFFIRNFETRLQPIQTTPLGR